MILKNKIFLNNLNILHQFFHFQINFHSSEKTIQHLSPLTITQLYAILSSKMTF